MGGGPKAFPGPRQSSPLLAVQRPGFPHRSLPPTPSPLCSQTDPAAALCVPPDSETCSYSAHTSDLKDTACKLPSSPMSSCYHPTAAQCPLHCSTPSKPTIFLPHLQRFPHICSHNPISSKTAPRPLPGEMINAGKTTPVLGNRICHSKRSLFGI